MMITLKSLELMERNKFVGSFGIPYLDDKLNCVQKNDLILIGARSGAGKSTLAQMIASHNSRQGIKTTLLSLENFEGDDFLNKVYYLYMQEMRDYSIHQRAFVSMNMNYDFEALERAEELAKDYFKNIDIVSRQKGFSIDDMKKAMVTAVEEKGSKILILDHIDYIDKDNPNESDVSHVSEIMRTIRNLQDAFGVAVIAFSHLRKPFSSVKAPAVPSMDEFIGSSNKVKEATAVIMFAPDDVGNQELAGSTERLTWCCIRKLRLGGQDNTTARIVFNTRTGMYDDSYTVHSVTYGGEVKDQLTWEGKNGQKKT